MVDTSTGRSYKMSLNVPIAHCVHWGTGDGEMMQTFILEKDRVE